MAFASLGSATANDAFFSSFRWSRKPESVGVTFPSVSAFASSTAAAELSNLRKCLSLSLVRKTLLVALNHIAHNNEDHLTSCMLPLHSRSQKQDHLALATSCLWLSTAHIQHWSR